MKWTVAALIAVSVSLSAGCAWLAKGRNLDNAVGEALHKVEPAVQHSTAVLQCAAALQAMFRDVGKAVPTSAALTFCAAAEASPSVAPANLPLSPHGAS